MMDGERREALLCTRSGVEGRPSTPRHARKRRVRNCRLLKASSGRPSTVLHFVQASRDSRSAQSWLALTAGNVAVVKAIGLDNYPAELALTVALDWGVRKFIKDVKEAIQ